jgi:hypothetical protein
LDCDCRQSRAASRCGEARPRFGLPPVRRLGQRRRGRGRLGKAWKGLHGGLGHRGPRALQGGTFHRRAMVIVRHAAPAGLCPAPVGLTIRRQPRIPRLPAFPAMHLRAPDAVVSIPAIEARGRVVAPAGGNRLGIFRRGFGRHAGRLDRG